MTDSIVESSDAYLSDSSFDGDDFYEDDDSFDGDSSSKSFIIERKKGVVTESFDDDNDDDGADDSSGTIDENLIDSDLEDDSTPSFRMIGSESSSNNQGFWKDIICWTTSSTTSVGTSNTSTQRISENNWTNPLGTDATAGHSEKVIPQQRLEYHQLSETEEKRAKTVFDHCANAHARLNEEQFRLALSLLGQIEKDDRVRKVFVKERAEWIDLNTFKRLLVELQVNSEISDLSANIQEAFDALYEGTCSDDDQRDEFGRRYIFARDLRLVLTSQGSGGRLTDEEADQLLRETHPTPLLSKDGQMLDAVFFEQFRSMLIDTNT